MPDEIDIFQFITNVELAGCLPLENEVFDGDSIYTLLSKNGKRRVFINTTDGTISKDIAIDFLWDLELGDMENAFFPQ